MFDYTLSQLMLLTDARAEAQETASSDEPVKKATSSTDGPPKVPDDVMKVFLQRMQRGEQPGGAF